MWFFWQRSQFTCGFAKLQLEFIGFQNDQDLVEHWWNPKSFKFGTFVVGSSMTAKKEHMKWFLTQNTFHGILSVCLGFTFLSQKLQGDKLQPYFVISDRPKLFDKLAIRAGPSRPSDWSGNFLNCDGQCKILSDEPSRLLYQHKWLIWCLSRFEARTKIRGLMGIVVRKGSQPILNTYHDF